MATDFTRAIRARETGEVLLELVTVSHSAFGATIRRVDNTEDIVSRGETWIAKPTEVTLPRESDRGATSGRIVLDDTDLAISAEFRKASTPPTVLIEIVRASATETVDRAYRSLEATGMRVDGTSVVLTIGLADYRREAFPSVAFGTDGFPELG